MLEIDSPSRLILYWIRLQFASEVSVDYNNKLWFLFDSIVCLRTFELWLLKGIADGKIRDQ